MLIKSSSKSDCSESEITPESIYLSRREFMTGAAAVAATSALPTMVLAGERYSGVVQPSSQPAWFKNKVDAIKWNSVEASGEVITPYKDASSYNNFYELGANKDDPAANAESLKIEPWTIVIDGEVDNPGTYSLEEFIKPFQLQERIYRLRCVEAWSMVIPWLGFPLSELLKRVQPTNKGKYVRFEAIADTDNLPGQDSRFGIIDWPYAEGLRLDEAMNPLTILAVGMYGRTLLNQNGAPLRLVVPWKYGFKSIKSIVRISLVKEQPKTSWQSIDSSEYGFYANVNPNVDHPRWSQATERRLPSGLFSPNVKKTLMFNGYEEEVGSLYAGLDLKVNY